MALDKNNAENDGLGDTANPKKLHEDENEQAIQKAQQEEDLLLIMTLPAGRRHTYRMISRFSVSPIMTGNSWTHHNLGIDHCRKSIETDLLAVCPLLYYQMLVENDPNIEDHDRRKIKFAINH